MARDVSDTTPVTSKAQLINWLEAGNKPAQAFRLGTEHEKFPFYLDDLSPVPYEGDPATGLGGIRNLLEGLQKATGWEPILDHEALIGLADPIGGGAVSLEPGGQFELSGAPLAYDLATDDEQRQLFRLLFGPLSLPRLFLAPPDVPRDRFEALSRAYEAVVADAEFAGEARRLGFDISPSLTMSIPAST